MSFIIICAIDEMEIKMKNENIINTLLEEKQSLEKAMLTANKELKKPRKGLYKFESIIKVINSIIVACPLKKTGSTFPRLSVKRRWLL